MLDLKALLTKILNAITPTQIASWSYTTGAANTWVKSGNFTIPTAGIYRVRAGYNNSAVFGIAYSTTSSNYIWQAIIIQENATAGSIDTGTWMAAGTYSLWTKCQTASKSNSIGIWKYLAP